MKSKSKQRAVGFTPNNNIASPIPSNPAEKIEFIRKGKKKKTITGFKAKQDITFENKGGKFVLVEKEKKFEEAGVTEKKRNYIKFESKLGTEKETDLTKIAGAKKIRAIEPRQEERIVQKRKKKEYLDNYQYHETKVIRNPKPNRISVVIHQRLGDIIGGFYEEALYEKQVFHTAGNSRPTSVFKQQQKTVAKTDRSSGPRRNVPSTSTVPQQSRKPLKPYNSVTNLRISPALGKVASINTSRRLSRNGDNPSTARTEVNKIETRNVKKNGQTTTTTTKTRTTKTLGRRTSGSILKNKKKK